MVLLVIGIVVAIVVSSTKIENPARILAICGAAICIIIGFIQLIQPYL